MANPYVNKVSINGSDVIDLTADTATAADVAQGKTFHLASGALATGTASGGSGVTYMTQAVSIPASAWSGTTATVSASAVTADSDVIVAPAPASMSAWAAAGVYCSAQGAGTLTFACTTAPTAALTAYVMAFEGGAVVTTKYSIVNNTNGAVSVDKTEAAEGETVTITVLDTSASFAVSKLGTNSTGAVLSGSGDTYTFVMPAYAVSVDVGGQGSGGGSN